ANAAARGTDRGTGTRVTDRGTDRRPRGGADQTAGDGALGGLGTGAAGLSRQRLAFHPVLFQPLNMGIIVGIDRRLPSSIGIASAQIGQGRDDQRPAPDATPNRRSGDRGKSPDPSRFGVEL